MSQALGHFIASGGVNPDHPVPDLGPAPTKKVKRPGQPILCTMRAFPRAVFFPTLVLCVFSPSFYSLIFFFLFFSLCPFFYIFFPLLFFSLFPSSTFYLLLPFSPFFFSFSVFSRLLSFFAIFSFLPLSSLFLPFSPFFPPFSLFFCIFPSFVFFRYFPFLFLFFLVSSCSSNAMLEEALPVASFPGISRNRAPVSE